MLSGTVAGGFTSAECITSPCAGWTTTSDGIWQYGSPAQPSYVAFAPYGGFSAKLDGKAVSIAQIQFQNAVNWGSGRKPEDDPTASYTAALSIQLLFTSLGGQTADFAWDLNVNAIRNGQDTLFQLPTSIAPVRVAVDGKLYDFNLLGFYQKNTQVTEMKANPWQWTSAELRASFTTASETTPAPEPGFALLLLPALGALVWWRHRKLS